MSLRRSSGDGGRATVSTPDCDVLVIGGGPAGATAALKAAQHGLRVVVLERSRHPRFHVGESFLPRNLALIRELGLEEGLKAIPQTAKLGASFALGHETEPRHYHFADGLLPFDPEAFNIERAPFDDLIARAAREAGAELIEGVGVQRIVRLEQEAVEVVTDVDGQERSYRGRLLLDASGQSTVVGRHLGTRRTLTDLKKVAYFNHFRNVQREPGKLGGYPLVVMCSEGWFWLIPIDEDRMSVGLVIDSEMARQTRVPAREMLAWGIARCPLVRARTRDADVPDGNQVTADFSYSCDPYSGPGYFLVGDAATFIDPVFSTGVCLGMMSAVLAADLANDVLCGKTSPERAQRRYRRYVKGSSAPLFRLVRSYYRHAFRELFLHGRGPFDVHRAVITLLAGHVFSKPAPSVRWRSRLFEGFVAIQERWPLVPRLEPWSLLAAPPEPRTSLK